MTEKTLGVLLLENTVQLPGYMAHPGTYAFPIKTIKVPGATADKVVKGDPSLRAEYARCARELEAEGVAAITSNCGFTALFQEDVTAAVSVPVGLSSLMLVPQVARSLSPTKKIGLVTFDSANLKEAHFAAAGWSSKDIPVVIAGVDGSESWLEMLKPVPVPSATAMISDVMDAVGKLLVSDPDIGAFVFECTGFPIAAGAVRQETGLPVFDSLSLATTLFEFSPTRN